MEVIRTAISRSASETWRNFLVFFIGSFILIVIALVVDGILSLFVSACSEFAYPVNHVLSLLDANTLTAFSSVFMVSLAARLLLTWRAADAAFLIAKNMLTNAVSGIAGVMFAMGVILAVGDEWQALQGAFILTAGFFILLVAGNAELAHQGPPLTHGQRTVIGLLWLAAAVALPIIGAATFTPEPPKAPQKCISVAGLATERATPN